MDSNINNTAEIADLFTALESNFPNVEISQVAEQESWRKEINRPIYHIHKWWATRLGSVFRAIILGALTRPKTNIWSEFYKIHNLNDKIVLDPFMGSGTTLGESLKLGAKAIGCDINPVSTFQVRQAFASVSEEELQNAFSRLEKNVAENIRKYYRTKDPETNESIPVLYYFWVKLVVTPEGEEIPLFSKYVFSQDAYPKKKPMAKILCPSCWSVLEERYDATDTTCMHCKHHFNPQTGPVTGQFVTSKDGKKYKIKELINRELDKSPTHRMYSMIARRNDGSKVYLSIKDHDNALYREANERLAELSLPLPSLDVRQGHNTNQALGYNYNSWRDFFNSRQLLCLGMLLQEILKIEDISVQEQMLCLFSSTLEFNNLFCSFKGEGTGAVRHMFSNHILKPERTPLESSVWGTDRCSGTFSTLFESRLLRARRYLDKPFEIQLEYDEYGNKIGSNKVLSSNPVNATLVDTWEELVEKQHSLMVLNGDSSKLPIQDKSVDAVITDPPYFDYVHYSELSDFFYAWLSPVLGNRYQWLSKADSSDKGEVQHKDPRVFSRQLSSVFKESCRVLKDGGILAFSFHHSKAEGWAAIYEALNHAGLAVVAAHPVHAELRGASPKSLAKDPISLDAILVCRKKAEVSSLTANQDILSRVNSMAIQLENAGMRISLNDKFVIGAALTLIDKAQDNLSFDNMQIEVDSLKSELNINHLS
ncbi:DNA methyltransferase [Pectobacterium versatile]|uniref:DNA methyltransferase n=1 Tax=Pectobacterium versatile TaxID=2488639 RepID=UPI002B244DB7|nr:DNA methyltransferase [Pectobacterium versatile]